MDHTEEVIRDLATRVANISIDAAQARAANLMLQEQLREANNTIAELQAQTTQTEAPKKEK